MWSDYFVSKKPGRCSLNNCFTLHCIFIDVGWVSHWRCFVWITFMSSFPSAHTYTLEYTHLSKKRSSLWAHISLQLPSDFSAALHSKTFPKSCLHNLPLSSTWVTIFANLTSSCLPSFSLTSQQQSTQLNKPLSWERFSSLAPVISPLWAFLLRLSQSWITFVGSTVSQWPRSQCSALFLPFPRAHIFTSFTWRVVMLPDPSPEF